MVDASYRRLHLVTVGERSVTVGERSVTVGEPAQSPQTRCQAAGFVGVSLAHVTPRKLPGGLVLVERDSKRG
jgi:hypothetical protein